jgi:hypothetical protein
MMMMMIMMHVFTLCSVSVCDVLCGRVTCLKYRLEEEIADRDGGGNPSKDYRYFEKINFGPGDRNLMWGEGLGLLLSRVKFGNNWGRHE